MSRRSLARAVASGCHKPPPVHGQRVRMLGKVQKIGGFQPPAVLLVPFRATGNG
jgi:hypothetical protein